MAIVSTMARPTNSVRDSGPCDSGWRAIASWAAAIARPSAKAGTMAPTETAAVAQMILSISTVTDHSAFLDRADGSANEHGRQDCKDVRLYDTDQDVQRHEGQSDEQARERDHDAHDQ